ncbi:MAG: HD domain-containing protein, partial [Planctomycetes bacterium]|nr:HD domain-containing protein [Planctomycetota bacterium]
FTENEPNSKLYHDRLTPQMSAMIILSHVKEGVEIARQHKLPRVLEDFITGHHGTSSVKYFYHKAKMQATNGAHVEESQFRYPGPKPQSREAAILAIADLVEASGRAKLDGPQTPATMQKFVHDAIMTKLSDGQFDECDITMRDLKLAEDAMVKALVSMYHHRIKYPDDPDARIKKLAMMEKEEYRKELAKRKEKILTQ